MEPNIRRRGCVSTTTVIISSLIFSKSCVAPILEMEEAHRHPHNDNRKLLSLSADGILVCLPILFVSLPNLLLPVKSQVPNPAPRLSRTPGQLGKTPLPIPGQHSLEILKEFGFTNSETQLLLQSNAVINAHKSNL